MRVDALTILTIMSLGATPRALYLPPSRHSTLSRRSDPSTCEFYGYADGNGVYNQYTVEIPGWGDGGMLSSCAPDITSYIQKQCMTAVDDFSCIQVYESPHETLIKFRLNKVIVTQPDCVTQAMKLLSQTSSDEEAVNCICLAECWASEMS
ncbi:hypothetical protein F4861DRAFT_171899 [Xylaria intraflava]|nr:hypothetical protein F4861DRAFT_171899 [Xylaria intraflava]